MPSISLAMSRADTPLPTRKTVLPFNGSGDLYLLEWRTLSGNRSFHSFRPGISGILGSWHRPLATTTALNDHSRSTSSWSMSPTLRNVRVWIVQLVSWAVTFLRGDSTRVSSLALCCSAHGEILDVILNLAIVNVIRCAGCQSMSFVLMTGVGM